MKKIGIWLRYGYSPSTGGGFSYYDAFMTKLQSFAFDEDICWSFVTPGSYSVNSNTICLGLIPDRFRAIRKLANNSRISKALFYINKQLFKSRWKRKLIQENISFIYYVNQDDTILTEYPYVATVWDMGFYQTFPFPELVQGNNFEGRRKLFTHTLQKALMVFSESEAGKEDLIKYANINPGKIRVVPIFAGNVVNTNTSIDDQVRIMSEYGLTKEKFFFYPAQFWAHKNHVGIIKAFSKIHKLYPNIKVVFTGGDKGNMDYVKTLCVNYGLIDCVLFLGYVSRDALYTFYKNATSLIMASYFGPTNMPPIEALSLGCPVICTDISGHREIMGDAALYFKPQNNEQLYHCMLEMINRRGELARNVILRAQSSKFTVENALSCVNNYLKECISIRDNWE